MTRIRLLLAAISVPVTAAALVLVTQGAQASTAGCTTGAYTSYCGTQANDAATMLVLDSNKQGTNTNNPIIGWPNSTADPGTDWVQLNYGGDAANGVMWIYAPNGVISNMCASDPGNGLVVLRGCNGSNWQRWIATSSETAGFVTWTNRATHNILSSAAQGAQLTTVAPPSHPGGSQVWKFVG